MTSTGIFAMACPECGGQLTEPEGVSRGLHACATCGRTYLVHLGTRSPSSS